jgi:hypothetical protein
MVRTGHRKRDFFDNEYKVVRKRKGFPLHPIKNKKESIDFFGENALTDRAVRTR